MRRAPGIALLLAILAAGCAPPWPASPSPDDSAAGDSAHAAGGRCMERHIREAIALNRERMPRYAALTGGRSEAVSRRLIRTEQLTAVVARYVDWRARGYQRAGIRIVCDDFVPMAHAPAFRERIPEPPPLSAFAPADARRIRRAVKQAHRAGGFPGASAALEAEIARLGAAPAFHCMLRHLLESALRVSNLAPRYAEQARARGLRSPEGLSRSMLDLHLAGLAEAAALDRRAAPLQAEGIPILCQDVPPIPPR